jgi:hypothetical protein
MGGSAAAPAPALRCEDDGRGDASEDRARARSSRSCCGEMLTDLQATRHPSLLARMRIVLKRNRP